MEQLEWCGIPIVKNKNVAKKVSNARACGSQRCAAVVPQSNRTVLCFFLQVSAELLRCPVRCVVLRHPYMKMETTRKFNQDVFITA